MTALKIGSETVWVLDDWTTSAGPHGILDSPHVTLDLVADGEMTTLITTVEDGKKFAMAILDSIKKMELLTSDTHGSV